MPWRSLAPLVEIRKPAPARCPTTVLPDQPGDGCTATPTGLSITTIASSSWMILIPSTISGTTANASCAGGIVTSSTAPPCTRSLLPTSEPSTWTSPWAMRSAALVRENPNIRAIAASTRSPDSPSGTKTVRCSAWEVISGRSGLRRRRGVGPGRWSASRLPSSATPRNVCRMIRPAATLMHMSAMLKTGQLGSIRKSTTCPWKGSGWRTTRSVRLPLTPPRSRPSATAHPVLRTRRLSHRTTTTAIAARQ